MQNMIFLNDISLDCFLYLAISALVLILITTAKLYCRRKLRQVFIGNDDHCNVKPCATKDTIIAALVDSIFACI